MAVQVLKELGDRLNLVGEIGIFHLIEKAHGQCDLLEFGECGVLCFLVDLCLLPDNSNLVHLL